MSDKSKIDRPAVVLIRDQEMVGIWVAENKIELDFSAIVKVNVGDVIRIDGETWAVIGRRFKADRPRRGEWEGATTLTVSPRS